MRPTWRAKHAHSAGAENNIRDDGKGYVHSTCIHEVERFHEILIIITIIIIIITIVVIIIPRY